MSTPFPPPTVPAPPGPTTPAPPQRGRRYAVIGLAAGLLGGAAIGLAGTAPLSSQAAELPPIADAPEPVIERGEWLSNALDPLVDNGTITAEQRDAVIEALREARPERVERPDRPHFPSHPGRGHPRFDREEVAALLGIDVDELAEQLRDGASLAELAEEQGVDLDTVIDVLLADVRARIEDFVTRSSDD